MRRASVSIALIFAFLIQSPRLLDACGDKLLMLGRGIQFQSRHSPRPAAVLLQLPAITAGSTRLSDPGLESALREAGHTVRTVVTKEELSEALRTGQFDVVVTDFSAAADLERTLAAAPIHPIVVPAVYLLSSTGQQQVRVDMASAAKQFNLVVQVPGRPGHYCAAVDKAMELKLKRDRASSPRS